MPPVSTEPRIQQSVSLLPRHIAGLKYLAERDGDTNLSATVRKLIERAMESRKGVAWADAINDVREQGA